MASTQSGELPVAVFDARWIKPEPSGIGVYAEALATRLPALLPRCRFCFLVRRDASESLISRLSAPCGEIAADVVRAPFSPMSPLDPFWLRKFLSGRHAAVYHTPNFTLPHAPPVVRLGGGRAKIIATIHDVIPLAIPDYAPASRTSRMRRIFRACLRSTVRGADAVFTVSETSRRDIVRTLGLGPGEERRIHAVPNGVSPEFSKAPRHEPRSARDPAERVLLYVGRRDPYKNVPLLVEAFATACARAPWPLRLVLAGAADPRYPEAETRAAELGVAGRVRVAGALPFEDLVALYAGADLLVHPSRYEGFGLQVAEAFACGLPVVCGDGGAVPEVAGSAARIVPLGSGPGAWADAILEVLSDPALAGEMRRKGLERARLFSWDAAAARIASFYPDIPELPESRSAVAAGAPIGYHAEP